MSDAAFVTGRLHIKEKACKIMIEDITEKQRQRCRRLAEERYEALRKTISHLYGQAFLDELEAKASKRIARLRLFDGINIRLCLLRKIYRHTCKISVNYGVRKAKHNSFFITFNKNLRNLKKQCELRDLRMMRKRSKARQRYNRLVEVIRRDFGEEMQKELIWKAEVRALAEIMDKYKYRNSSWIKGYCSNDRSFALRHLRILYAYQRALHQDMYGTRIHNQINANYRSGMLDYYKNE